MKINTKKGYKMVLRPLELKGTSNRRTFIHYHETHTHLIIQHFLGIEI